MKSIRCAICEVDIEVDEKYFHPDGEGLICKECFVDYVEDLRRRDPAMVADALEIPWNYVADVHDWDDDRDRREY